MSEYLVSQKMEWVESSAKQEQFYSPLERASTHSELSQFIASLDRNFCQADLLVTDNEADPE